MNYGIITEQIVRIGRRLIFRDRKKLGFGPATNQLRRNHLRSLSQAQNVVLAHVLAMRLLSVLLNQSYEFVLGFASYAEAARRRTGDFFCQGFHYSKWSVLTILRFAGIVTTIC